MTIPSLLLAIALAGSADDLVTKKLTTLKLKVPGAWSQKLDEGSHRFDSPSEDAGIEIAIYPVTPREPARCLEQLIDAVGTPNWERISVGNAPAAKKINLDDTDANKGEFQTVSVLGCDGRTKWLLTFSMKTGKKDRYLPLLDKILKSVSYVRGGN